MGIIQLGSNTPSFEDPIAMLLACHGKIRRLCAELSLLPEHLALHGWDDVAVSLSADIARWHKVTDSE